MKISRLHALVLTAVLAGPLQAGDRHAGYYYPAITSEETFDRVIRQMDGADKAVRVGFVNALTNDQMSAPASPRFAIFAKGEDADELIVVALDDEVFSTIYRARAIMAQLTVAVRQGVFFQEEELETVATFYDLLQMMEFDEIIVSDGKTWTHKVILKRN